MDVYIRIEHALEAALRPTTSTAPPRLGQAIRQAVFPGGARFRPRLSLAVARACGDAHPELARAAAVAVELLHCASLVYDDLPCFDDAPLRRGQPTVHVTFGEEVAILAGNALIVRAFELLGEQVTQTPLHTGLVLATLARGVGSPHGIAAGQAWESEPRIDLRAYHRAKTGALFEAAVIAGAVAGGGDARAWRGLGDLLGEAYQVADDLRDAHGESHRLGKPVGQDAAHGRPSAVGLLGADGALRRLHRLLADAIERVPSCPGRSDLVLLIERWADTLVPREPVEAPRIASAS
ncbi:MAG: polyprenyl synthetase family protein [Myxococcales bacterium]|nr:polyprenyl synthetase family protein [Myxococcales bacterium]